MRFMPEAWRHRRCKISVTPGSDRPEVCAAWGEAITKDALRRCAATASEHAAAHLRSALLWQSYTPDCYLFEILVWGYPNLTPSGLLSLRDYRGTTGI